MDKLKINLKIVHIFINCLEIAALTSKYSIPVSVYSKMYSNIEKNFISENEEALKGLNFIRESFDNKGIKALDRGYDNKTFYKHFAV
ncbi:hypothetical protein [Clostridium sp. AWRP]|uniref:hypothetical protein n=1 Tax=Clostridium sp. AWRP TaxID=2212991 RepID=UPI000FDB3FD1|nr:hypothetical protein [Clostridium sp. AWRP]